MHIPGLQPTAFGLVDLRSSLGICRSVMLKTTELLPTSSAKKGQAFPSWTRRHTNIKMLSVEAPLCSEIKGKYFPRSTKGIPISFSISYYTALGDL